MAVIAFLKPRSTLGKACGSQEGILWAICAAASTATCFLLFKMCVSDFHGSDWCVQLTCTIGAGALGLLCCLCLSPQKDEQGGADECPKGVGASRVSLSSFPRGRKEAWKPRDTVQQGVPDPPVHGEKCTFLVEPIEEVALFGVQEAIAEEIGERSNGSVATVEEVCGRGDMIEGLAASGAHVRMGAGNRIQDCSKSESIANGSTVDVTMDSAVDEAKGGGSQGQSLSKSVVCEGPLSGSAIPNVGMKNTESAGHDGISLGLGLVKFVSHEECVSEMLDDTLGSPLSEYGSDDDLGIGGEEPEEMTGEGSGSGGSAALADKGGLNVGGVGVAERGADVMVAGLTTSEMGETGRIGEDSVGFLSGVASLVEAECLSEPGSSIRSRGICTASSGSGSLTGLGRGARRQFAGFLAEFWSGVFDLHGKPAGPLDINEWLRQAQLLDGASGGNVESAIAVGAATILTTANTALQPQKTIPANMRTTGLLGGARDDYRLGMSVDRDMSVNPRENGLDSAAAVGRNWHHNFVQSGLEWGSDSPRQRGLGLCDAELDARADAKRALMRSPHGSDEALSPERLGAFMGGGGSASNGGLLPRRQSGGSYDKSGADWMPPQHPYANRNQVTVVSQLGHGNFAAHHDMKNMSSASPAPPLPPGSGIGDTLSSSSPWEVASSAYDTTAAAATTAAGFRTRPASWHPNNYVNYEQSHVDPQQFRMQTRMRSWEETGLPSGTGTGAGRQLPPDEQRLEQGWQADLWRSQAQAQAYPHGKDFENAVHYRPPSSAAAPLNATSSMRTEQPRHPDDFQGPGRETAPTPALSYDRFGNLHSHSLWSSSPHEQLFPSSVARGPGGGGGIGYGREHPPSYCTPGVRPGDVLRGGGQMVNTSSVNSYQIGRAGVGATRRLGGVEGVGEMREVAGLRDGWYSAQKGGQYQLSLEEEGRHGSWPRASSEMYRSSSGGWHGRESSGSSLRTTHAQSHHSAAIGGVQPKDRDRDIVHSGRHASLQSSQPTVIFQNGTEVLKALRTCVTHCLKLEGSEWLFRTGCGPDENLVAAVGACVQVRHLLMGCGNSCAWGPGIMVSFGVWCVRRVLELSRLESRPELWGKYTYVLNHLQGILEPAFLRPRTVGKLCMCLSPHMATLPSKQSLHAEEGDMSAGMGRSISNGVDGGVSRLDDRGKANEAELELGASSHGGVGRLHGGGEYSLNNSQPLKGAGAAKFLEIIKDVEQAVASRKGRTGTAAGDVAFPKGKENLASVLKRYKRRLANKPMGGGGNGSQVMGGGGGGVVRDGRGGGPGRARSGSYNGGLIGHSVG